MQVLGWPEACQLRTEVWQIELNPHLQSHRGVKFYTRCATFLHSVYTVYIPCPYFF